MNYEQDSDVLLREALKAAKEYADDIIKTPLQQLGGILSDTIGYWRLRNQVSILLKTKALLEAKGVRPGTIKPDLFIPIMSSASVISDETLQDMFSRLLSEVLQPSWPERVHPSFAQIIGQLTPVEASVLKTAFESDIRSRQHDDGTYSYRNLVNQQGSMFVSQMIHLSFAEQNFLLENLNRLGMVTRSEKHGFILTEFGLRFCRACLPL